jgi:hypothetical protein
MISDGSWVSLVNIQHFYWKYYEFCVNLTSNTSCLGSKCLWFITSIANQSQNSPEYKNKSCELSRWHLSMKRQFQGLFCCFSFIAKIRETQSTSLVQLLSLKSHKTDYYEICIRCNVFKVLTLNLIRMKKLFWYVRLVLFIYINSW